MKTEIRIVIADDHPVYRRGLSMIVAADSALKIVAEAEDGEAALKHIRAEEPDVAVLDVDMPLKGGFDVVRAMQPLNLHTAVVFLTIGAILAWSEPNRRLKVFYIATATFLALLVGVSRIYLGVHFPTDVIAGWCIGSAWAIGCILVAQWINLRLESSAR